MIEFGTMNNSKLTLLKSRGNIEWRLVDEFKTFEYNIKTEVSLNGLIAILSFKKNADKSINVVELLQKLKTSKIKFDNFQAIMEIFNDKDNLASFADLIIAKGTAPVHGKDARIEYLFEISKDTHFKEKEDGSVDYKDVAKFISMSKGAVLAKYIEETTGVNGVDVYGESVTAHVGKPEKLIAGKNTLFDEKTKTIVAEVDGIPFETLGVIKIDPTLHIKEDIDLAVGNVDFSGDIYIGGDVLDGFKVKSAGNIIIGGVVGAAELTCPGTITIHGGVNGHKKGVIKCKKLEAKYLNEAFVECSEEIRISKGIINSIVYTQGCIFAGVLISGKTIALHGIELQEVGVEQGVITEVEIGTDYVALKAFNAFVKKRTQIDDQLSILIPNIEPYIDSYEKFYKLEPSLKDKAIEIFKEFQSLKKERIELESLINDCELSFRLHRDLKKPFIVNKMAYEGLIIKSRVSQFKLLKTFKGPLSFREKRSSHTFEIGGV